MNVMIISRLKKFIVMSVITAAFAVPCSSAFATEGGGGAYPNGAEDVMAGAIPPAGFYYLNYLNYYTADALKDNSGDKIDVHFKANVLADVSRFVYVTKTQIAGGNLGFQTLIPLVNMHLETPAGKDNASGLGDIDLGVNLSWHSKNLHQALALDVDVPTGAYDKNDIANIGRNCYTFEPAYGISYVTDGGYEVSGKFMYDFNTENNDTDYKSGQEFHVDYFTGQHVGSWTVGLGGYYYQQITDDKSDGETVDDYKGRVLGVGPTIQYNYKNIGIHVKYQKETLVENRSEGDKYWVRAVFSF